MTTRSVTPGREPSVTTCQNLFRGERADWRDARTCPNPALDLGDGRALCQPCREASGDFAQQTLGRWAAALVKTGQHESWLETTNAIIAELDATLARLGARRAPLSELRTAQRDLALRLSCRDAVMAALLHAGQR